MHGVTARGDGSSAGSVPRLARVLAAAGVVSVLLGLCVWRIACVRSGPDPDTDAYGHFLIARQLLATPLQLRIHWVWLPLYHLLLALPIALGATLDQIRQANALATALPPLLLGCALARGWRGAAPASRATFGVQHDRVLDDPVVLGAVLLTAINPLLIQLGTTGQMEVFFCTLLTLAVALLAWERFSGAALVLSALVLTRYEGWAVAAAVAAVLLQRRRRSRLMPGEWACVLAPGACVLAWAALRRLGGEPWFGFVLDTRAFAERALGDSARGGTLGALLSLVRYVAIVPWRYFGPAAACALLGVGPTLRRHGVWLVAPGLAILAFLTLTSLMRSQLGLDRHFTSVVPFAATWIAHGLMRIVAGLGSMLERALDPRRARRLRWLAAAPFILSTSACSYEGLMTWRDATREALREPRAVAALLRATPPDALIVCGDAAIEVLSELPPGRFSRLPPALLEAQLAELHPARHAYIVQRTRQLGDWARAGVVVYGALDGPADAFVVMRVTADEMAHVNGVRHGG